MKEASAPKRTGRWVLGALLIATAVIAASLGWVTARGMILNQTGYALEPMGTPNPPLMRATLIRESPQPTHAVRNGFDYWVDAEGYVHQDMIPGHPYWVTMPDGRSIKINFKGTVSDYMHLPIQPSGGANNAAYHTLNGNTWIWTVPVGASNVPQWIDP